MKTRSILALFAVALGAATTRAQPSIPEYVPVKINQTEDATYPSSAVSAGVKSGAASIAISVDDQGKLTDTLVTAYSHPAFAERALSALSKWTFEPARIHGIARNSKADLTFWFEMKGVAVVSMDIMTDSELLHYKVAGSSDAYSACKLSELDHIPNPKKIVAPVYPKQMARSSQGGHLQVEFYIDPEGHVRMPSVSPEAIEANEELAAVAVTAVSQWQFDRPLSKGVPVLVLAHQDFDFKPAAQ
jgi:TonB family protein